MYGVLIMTIIQDLAHDILLASLDDKQWKALALLLEEDIPANEEARESLLKKLPKMIDDFKWLKKAAKETGQTLACYFEGRKS